DDVEAERAVFEVGVEGDPVGDLGAVPAVASGADEFDEVFVVLGHRRPPIGPRPVISAPCSPWFWGRATMRLGFIPSRLPGSGRLVVRARRGVPSTRRARSFYEVIAASLPREAVPTCEYRGVRRASPLSCFLGVVHRSNP